MFSTSVFRTSPIPFGAAASVSAACVSDSVIGNSLLAITATNAARKVLSIYNIITVLNFFPIPPPAFARELITNTNTSTGATAFSAPTNTSPSTPIILS